MTKLHALNRRISTLIRHLEWRYRGLSDETVFERNGFTWCGPTRCSISKSIFITGGYQDHFIAPLLQCLRADGNPSIADGHVINIGANLGDVAIPLTRHVRKVIAIEPNPETFGRLLRNVKSNNLDDRIRCVNVAVGGEDGKGTLAIASNPGNSELVPASGTLGFSPVDKQTSITEVSVRRIDTLLDQLDIDISEVSLVWSDTQGFETEVIRSGQMLWARGVPLWVEVWPRGLECHGGVAAFVAACCESFTSFRIGTTGIGERKDICDLAGFVESIPNGEFVDVLLQAKPQPQKEKPLIRR
jgi:FkbM family methyltransferase